MPLTRPIDQQGYTHGCCFDQTLKAARLRYTPLPAVHHLNLDMRARPLNRQTIPGSVAEHCR
jgi:hypothetical protein